jgi:hypothetical protein
MLYMAHISGANLDESSANKFAEFTGTQAKSASADRR